MAGMKDAGAGGMVVVVGGGRVCVPALVLPWEAFMNHGIIPDDAVVDTRL